jgi:hypothetical protein
MKIELAAGGMIRRAAMVLALLLAGQLAAAGVAEAATSPLNETVDRTYQTNGTVRAIVTIGNTTYLGGQFTSVRPAGSRAGTNEVSRPGLAAVDNTTGALLPWNPRANGRVYALAASPDGTTIYAGGTFSTLGGVRRVKLGAVSAQTGAVLPFNASANGAVWALAATSDRLYVGGAFTTINGVSRGRLAAVDAGGSVLADWAPRADDTVRAVAVTADASSVYVGGLFGSINGSTTQRRLAKLSATTAAFQPWSERPGYPLFSLSLSGDSVFVGGNGSGGHAAEYTTSGVLRWKLQTDGGVQAVYALDGLVYVGGHYDNVCVGDTDGATSGFNCPVGQISETRHKIMAVVPDPTAPSGLGYRVDEWNPGANSNLGVFSFGNAGSKLQVGGSFTRIGLGQAQQGYAQFSPT